MTDPTPIIKLLRHAVDEVANVLLAQHETLRAMQSTLPWNADGYSDAFLAHDVPHRDFAHALLHVFKAAGKLTVATDEADHVNDRDLIAKSFASQEITNALADIVICAMRLANVTPGRVIDLQSAVEARIEEKFTPAAADPNAAGNGAAPVSPSIMPDTGEQLRRAMWAQRAQRASVSLPSDVCNGCGHPYRYHLGTSGSVAVPNDCTFVDEFARNCTCTRFVTSVRQGPR